MPLSADHQQHQQYHWPSEQAVQLLRRLASSPNLALWKEKYERVNQLLCNLSNDGPQLQQQQLGLLQCAALAVGALANGLQLLQPLLLLDLPGKSVRCIAAVAGLLVQTEKHFTDDEQQYSSYSNCLMTHAIHSGLVDAAAAACDAVTVRLSSPNQDHKQPDSEQTNRVCILVLALLKLSNQLLPDSADHLQHKGVIALLQAAARLAVAAVRHIKACSNEDLGPLGRTHVALTVLQLAATATNIVAMVQGRYRYSQLLEYSEAVQSQQQHQVAYEKLGQPAYAALLCHVHASQDVALLAVLHITRVAQHLHLRQEGASTVLQAAIGHRKSSSRRAASSAGREQRQQQQQGSFVVPPHHLDAYEALGMKDAASLLLQASIRAVGSNALTSDVLDEREMYLLDVCNCLVAWFNVNSVCGYDTDGMQQIQQLVQQQSDSQEQHEQKYVPDWLAPMIMSSVQVLALLSRQDVNILFKYLHVFSMACMHVRHSFDADYASHVLTYQASRPQLDAVEQHLMPIRSILSKLVQQLSCPVLQLLGPLVVQACRNNSDNHATGTKQADAQTAQEQASACSTKPHQETLAQPQAIMQADEQENGCQNSPNSAVLLTKAYYACMLGSLRTFEICSRTRFLSSAFKQQPLISAGAMETAFRSEITVAEPLVRFIAEFKLDLSAEDSIKQLAARADVGFDQHQLSQQLLLMLTSALKAAELFQVSCSAWHYTQIQGIAEMACILVPDQILLAHSPQAPAANSSSGNRNHSLSTKDVRGWVALVARCVAVLCRRLQAAGSSDDSVSEPVALSSQVQLTPQSVIASLLKLVFWLGKGLSITVERSPAEQAAASAEASLKVPKAKQELTMLQGLITQATADLGSLTITEAGTLHCDPAGTARAAAGRTAPEKTAGDTTTAHARQTVPEPAQHCSPFILKLRGQHYAVLNRLQKAAKAAKSVQPCINNPHLLLQDVQQLVGAKVLHQVQDFAEAVCAALPFRHWCNNMYCTNVKWQSEAELVSSRGSRCSGCRASYYCSSECQLAAWQLHKPLCRFLQHNGPR